MVVENLIDCLTLSLEEVEEDFCQEEVVVVSHPLPEEVVLVDLLELEEVEVFLDHFAVGLPLNHS